MEPTVEQIKKFWEYFGLKYSLDQDVYRVTFPDGDYLNFGHDADMRPSDVQYWDDIEPGIDLNNLFRWAVPKLVEKIGKHRAHLLLSGCLSGAILLEKIFEGEVFQAINKVIDGDNTPAEH